jgi:hypothetical protein
MLTQRNLEEAAKAVGVGTATLLRWQKLPEFQTAYRQARRAAVAQAVARLQQGTGAAATTLFKTMIDPNTPASVRVRAAEVIFNHSAKAIEIEDIDVRVTALEKAAGGAAWEQSSGDCSNSSTKPKVEWANKDKFSLSKSGLAADDV